MVWVWNLAALIVGLGFFYPDSGWLPIALGGGFTALTLSWGYLLVRIAEQRWRLVTALRR
jgi:cytochrome c oxidase cbb3-type subunit I